MNLHPRLSVFCFQIPGNVEFQPKHLVYSNKQHLFLVVYEFSGATNEVVLYWENTNSQSANSKASTMKGLSCQFKHLSFAVLLLHNAS